MMKRETNRYTITRQSKVTKNRAHIVTAHRTLPKNCGKTAGLNCRAANDQSARCLRNYTVIKTNGLLLDLDLPILNSHLQSRSYSLRTLLVAFISG